jgi:hypothetical protein
VPTKTDFEPFQQFLNMTFNLHCSLTNICCMLQGDRLFSQAHDELYQFSFERQRWGPLALRPPKVDRKREAAAAHEQRDSPVAADDMREGPSAGAAATDAAMAAALEQRTTDGSGAAQPSGLICSI